MNAQILLKSRNPPIWRKSKPASNLNYVSQDQTPCQPPTTIIITTHQARLARCVHSASYKALLIGKPDHSIHPHHSP